MNLREAVEAEPWNFDLLALLRRLERGAPDKPRIGLARTLGDEFVELSQEPFLEFPASNIAKARVLEPSRRMRLVVRFLGMFGPQGALPLSTTEEALHWLDAGDDAFARFVDVVQKRFLALYFRAWADAHPIAQNERPLEDRFRAYIGSMIGIGTKNLRDADSLDDFAKMQYAGLLAPRVKSASRLRSFLAGLLGTPVEIEEFVGDWLALDPGERSRLGGVNSRLGGPGARGEDCMLGASLYSVSDKFRVRVFVRDIEHFQTFLPGSPAARRVADAIHLYLGFEYDWDMEIAIPAGKITPVSLGRGAKLGWTSWMSPNWAKTDETMRKDARFHVVSRLAAERGQKARN